MTEVIYFEWSTKYIMNSLSLPGPRASLRWLVGWTLDHWLFASHATSGETQVGAQIGAWIGARIGARIGSQFSHEI